MAEPKSLKTYIITGGTGSLGTALTKHLLEEGHKVRAYARNEHSHEALEQAVKGHPRLSCLVGDVRDLNRLTRACQDADYLIHAAAMKIVPRCEYDPIEAVRTNVMGTQSAIEAVLNSSIQKAILVSTDKASAPVNLYGATKLCAERMWLAGDRYRGHRQGRFVACRYGNVFGSAGSVVWRFLSGHHYITHKAMTRFHLTMNQAVGFVLSALSAAVPGELWIPKLPRYKVTDLFRLCCPGVTPMFSSVRPGEKLHETLISGPESLSIAREADTHYVLTPGVAHQPAPKEYSSAQPHGIPLEDLKRDLENLVKCQSL